MRFITGQERAWPWASLVILLTATAPHAATYYVSPQGSDTNSGSASQPWFTLQKAANSVRAGDLVLVADGTYTGMQVRADGTASAPITFRADGQNVVVNAPNSSTPDNINLEGADYVVIDGFKVENAPRVGIRAVTSVGDVIHGNTVTGSGLTGILTGFAVDVEISDNVSSGALTQHGIYVSNSSTADDNPVVRGNECFDNYQNGIQFNGDCNAGGDGIISGAVIEDNIVHHNNWKGLSLISLQNSLIRNNIIYDNGLSAGAGGIHLADQPGCGKPSSYNTVVNNTVDEPRITGIRMSNGSTGNTIFNNVVVGPDGSKLIVDEVGGNDIDASSNLETTSDTGLFVSPSTGDFRLAAQSAAVDLGAATYDGLPAPAVDAVGTQRPQGLRPDAGAFEQMTATGVSNTPAFAVDLEQNVPNPFNPSTVITFDVPAASGARVSLDVFDVRGAHVRSLVRGRPATGPARVAWDGRDDAGRRMASGVYLYRLVAGATVRTRRMTLLK